MSMRYGAITMNPPVLHRPFSRNRKSRSSMQHRHGWTRKEDQSPPPKSQVQGPTHTRNSTGLTILILFTLAILTVSGLAKVRSQNLRLEMAKEITQLAEIRNHLLERKRVLEKRQASLRHPRSIAKQARERLGMQELPPERIMQFEGVITRKTEMELP